ncbi:MAG: MFS transporter, partial [Anaerolineales bacterium]|jgi:predicted MFS family arabinose efflux permease
MFRMVYPFLPVFSRGMGVGLPALSFALTGRSVAGAFGPFLASISDRRGRKAGLFLGMILFTAGVVLVVIWPTYPLFFVSLILTTLGKYVFDPAMQAYLGDQVSYRRRGLVLAVTELGWSLSYIVGIPLMAFLIARGGWMSPFTLLALLGGLAIVLLPRMVPFESQLTKSRFGMWGNFRAVLRYTPALAGLSFGFLASSANELVNVVFGVWMEDSFGLQIAALGAASAVIGLSELGGEFAAGGLADRLGKPRAVSIGLILNSIAAVGLPLLGGSLTGAVVGLFLFYITFEFSIVSSIPLMTEILPSSRATLMSFNVAVLSLGRAVGALLAPNLYANGIIATGLAVLLLNIVALIALRKVGSEV